jgi:excisionase family DNA binding protein
MIAVKTTELLTTQAVANRLKISARRVLQLAEAGTLPSIPVSSGRRDRIDQRVFRAEDLEKLANRKSVKR